MDVFISWSGDRSLKVATALKDWLPLVIQSVEPWFSPEDIDKGARWMAELGKQLEKLKLGIICVTPENMQAPWLLFEAGALSKVLDTSLVCPFLYGLEPADLQGPLAQFQSTRSNKEDVRKLLNTINRCADSQLAEQQVDRLFSLLWPELEEKLSSIESRLSGQISLTRPVPDLISEVLERVRSIERQLADATSYNEIKEHELRMREREIVGREHLRSRLLSLKHRLSEAESRLSATRAERSELEQQVKVACGSEEENLESRLKGLACAEAEIIAVCDQVRSEQDVIAVRINDLDHSIKVRRAVGKN